MLLRLGIFFVFAFFSGANLEIIANRTADVFLSLFPAVPLCFAGPIDLAGLAAVHLGIRHNEFLLFKT